MSEDERKAGDWKTCLGVGIASGGNRKWIEWKDEVGEKPKALERAWLLFKNANIVNLSKGMEDRSMT